MRSQAWRSLLDPEILIGVPLSVGLAVIFYVYNETAGAFAVFAALLGIVITLQIHLASRLGKARERDGRLGELVGRMQSITWLSGVIDRMVTSTMRVERDYAGTPAVKMCYEFFGDTEKRLTSLEAGHFSCGWADHSLAIKLIDLAQHSMNMVSVVSIDLEWWDSQAGWEFWERQEAALRRDVVIQRVFVYESQSEALDRLVDRHRRAGVEVFTVRREVLREPVAIIGVWDGLCGQRLRFDSDGAPETLEFTVANQEVEELRRRFNGLKSVAARAG